MNLDIKDVTSQSHVLLRNSRVPLSWPLDTKGLKDCDTQQRPGPPADVAKSSLRKILL